MGTGPKDFAAKGGTVRAGMKNAKKRAQIRFTATKESMCIYPFRVDNSEHLKTMLGPLTNHIPFGREL
jgi:hypothetical protein